MTGTMLEPGDAVVLEGSGRTVTVSSFIAAGGEGEVYRVVAGGSEQALKWYYPERADVRQRKSLAVLVERGAPDARFLWPEDLASRAESGPFGYVMPLRDPRFVGAAAIMRDDVDPTFRSLCTAGYQLSDGFLTLHAQGLCYRDISFGNVFLDGDSGEVLICDNDNVGIDGERTSLILGTPKFMAPEVVLREELPSRLTDLYSLAVLLFYLLIRHHPLEGRHEEDFEMLNSSQALTSLYGAHPTFIFDPKDDSNRPLPGLHDNALVRWPVFPRFVHALFERAFTDGLRDPMGGRVQESEWREATIRLRDSIFFCASCGDENFFDPDAHERRKTLKCVHCGKRTVIPPRLQIRNYTVMLNQDTVLYPHHLFPRRRYDFSEELGAVSPHPTEPDTWGLTNRGADAWVVTTPEGEERKVAPGRTIRLIIGMKIRFGAVHAEIKG